MAEADGQRRCLAEALVEAQDPDGFSRGMEGVQRRGRPAGVLVSPERYEQLITALEDAEDVAAFDEAMAEEGPNIPWEQVKADLGWQ